jgi:hypothetical protein
LNSKLLFLLLALYTFFVLTCATPIGPTGGPRDEIGPTILFTEPESGTTNFDGDKISFYFDEFVNRGSLNNNITIEPDFGATYDIKWKRKRLTIKFNDPLPDSTTIILTLSGSISDTRGNQVGAPKIVAFSTGDEIDEGSIAGRLRNSDSGAGEATRRVALFREPIDLEKPYNYTAETDTGGYFRFSYLKEGSYKAFYFDDRNRNKIWEPPREHAQPFSIDTVSLGKADTLSIGELYLQTVDTLAPRLQAVGLFSDRRLRLRFNEDIALDDSVVISVIDTLGNQLNNGFPLFVPKEEEFILFVQSDSSLLEENTYEIKLEGVNDKAGNSVITESVRFNGSSQSDSTLQRIVEVETETGLFPTQPFVIKYASEITSRTLLDSIVVVEGDVTFDDWPELGVDRNRLFIGPQDEWIDGIDYQFLVWNPVTQRRVLFTPDIWDSNEMGELEISINDADSTGRYYYQLENAQNELSYSGVMDMNQTIENLPPLSYQLTIFKDLNGNEQWDRGEVSPFKLPEPYIIRRSVRIQTGFTAEVFVNF